MKLKSLTDTGEKRMLWRRILVYGLAFFLLAILQCAFFSRLKPFGATPDIVLGGICAVIMLDNKKAGAVCAVAAGYFIDAIGSVTPSFTTLFYLIAAVIIFALSDKMMPNIISFAAVMLSASAAVAAYTWICMLISGGALPPLSALWQTLLPAAISTFIFSLPVYFVIKLCTLPIEVNRAFR